MNLITEKIESRTFNEIKMVTPLVKDLITAERIAGNATGLNYALTLVSQVATFDGEKLPPEELHNLSAADFLKLSKALMDLGLTDLAKELSPSQSESLSKE